MKKFLAVFLLFAMLMPYLWGCVSDPNENLDPDNTSSEEDSSSQTQQEMTVWYVGEFSMQTKTVTVDILDAMSVQSELTKMGVIPFGMELLHFNLAELEGKKTIVLDFGEELESYLQKEDKEKVYSIVGSIVNTYLEAFQAERLLLTSGGKALSMEEYSGYLASFEADSPVVATDESFSDNDSTVSPPDTDMDTSKDDSSSDTSTDNTSGFEREEGVKYVAFTFDDGPHYIYTKQVVDKLKEYGASATFFVVGNRLTGASAEAMQYAYEFGNEIAIHGYTHTKYYSNCSDEDYASEINLTCEAISKYIDQKVTLMRPIGGMISQERISASEYGVILWSVDSADWKYKQRNSQEQIRENVDTIVDNVMSKIQDGDIVLMHDIYLNTYEAFCILIERLYADGYKLVTVSQLLGGEVAPGVKYNSSR